MSYIKGRIFILLGSLTLFSCSTAQAGSRTLYVSLDAKTKGKGTQSAPYQSLAKAIIKAKNNATIYVAKGIYHGNFTIKKKSVKIIGGYDLTFTKQEKYSSILRGKDNDSVLSLIHTKSVIDGFTIKNGLGSKRQESEAILGGGIYAVGGDSTIKNCLIEKNRTNRKSGDIEQAGGGVFARDGKINLVHNIIRNNLSKRGGGIALIDMKEATIKGNKIEKNIAIGDHGGGVYAAVEKLNFSGNLVMSNEVGKKIGYGWGGGVTVIGKATRATFEGDKISNNFAASQGSGFFIDDESQAIMKNELIQYNKCAPEGGSAIYVDGLDKGKGSQLTIKGSTIVGHPCGGVNKGNAVRAEQSSNVKIEQSVLWNNGEKELSFSADAKITIRFSLIKKGMKGDGLIHQVPRFEAPKKGDLRLKNREELIAGKRLGISTLLR